MNASLAGSCWASCTYNYPFSFFNTGSLVKRFTQPKYEREQRRLGRAIQDDLGYAKRIERELYLFDNLFVGSRWPGDVSCCLQSPSSTYFWSEGSTVVAQFALPSQCAGKAEYQSVSRHAQTT